MVTGTRADCNGGVRREINGPGLFRRIGRPRPGHSTDASPAAGTGSRSGPARSLPHSQGDSHPRDECSQSRSSYQSVPKVKNVDRVQMPRAGRWRCASGCRDFPWPERGRSRLPQRSSGSLPGCISRRFRQGAIPCRLSPVSMESPSTHPFEAATVVGSSRKPVTLSAMFRW